MFIQIFCYNNEEATTAVNLLNLHILDKKFRMELMYTVQTGYKNPKESESVADVYQYLIDNFKEELDNVGVYYNSGDFLYIRIFKDAKVNVDAYKG